MSSASLSGKPSNPAIADLYKEFGTDTEAGKLLRKLYAGTPAAAAAKVSYPVLRTRTSAAPKPVAQKPCPQRAHVSVPRVGGARRASSEERSRLPVRPSIRLREQIELDTENYRRDRVPIVARGKDYSMEKNALQDACEFGGGTALPKGAMGHAVKGPSAEEVRRNITEPRKRAEEDRVERQRIQAVIDDTVYEIRRKTKELEDKEQLAESLREQRTKAAATRVVQMDKEILRIANELQNLEHDLSVARRLLAESQ